jgi:acyl-CoA synthetase (NDP forming)
MNNLRKTLDRIFHPKSVAIVGASDNPLKMSYRCVESFAQIDYPGKVYPINNRIDPICGFPTYASLLDVPGDIDLALIVVQAKQVKDALLAAAKKHAAGAIIITAGFKEIADTAGAQLEAEIKKIADDAGMRIIGPNTFGMVNIGARLNASFTPVFSRLKPGPISMLGQSGGVCHLVGFQAIDERVGMNKIVGLGNRVNLEFHELLDYLADDPETETIILYVEGIENPRRLMEAARRVTARKPLVGLKVGQSAAASRAVQSHTGSLSGSYDLYYAAFEQAGIVPARDSVELLDIAKILTLAPPAAGIRAAIMSFQAGPGIVLTDLCVQHGLSMAELSPQTVASLRKLWPDLSIRTNPIDLAFVSDMGTFGDAARLALEDPNVDALIVFYLDMFSLFTAGVSQYLIPLAKELRKPIVVCANFPTSLATEMTAEGVARFEENGIPVYPLPERAVKALKGLVRRSEILRHFRQPK